MWRQLLRRDSDLGDKAVLGREYNDCRWVGGQIGFVKGIVVSRRVGLGATPYFHRDLDTLARAWLKVDLISSTTTSLMMMWSLQR